MNPDACRAQRGSGTVLMLAVVCVAAFALVAVLMFTAVAHAGPKAGTAADLAAARGRAPEVKS